MLIETTLGINKAISATFTPDSIAELKNNFLRIRRENKFISVVSKGNNWGYGCSAPNVENSFLINLEKCNRIVNFDEYHGTVTLEPGVTYGQLANFLKERGGNWIAPVHGGGPDCSVMGNCLERGYGITPNTDHFGAVLSLGAILNNGETYEGALKRLGQDKLDKLFKYGIGPYTDGLFTQSGLGIVTEITIKLAQAPDYIEMFYFSVYNEDDVASAVEAIKKTKKELGSNVGGINLMNKERLLSMTIDYPLDKIKNAIPLSHEELEFHGNRLKFTPWLVVGMLYGEKEVVKASKKCVLRNFKDIPSRKFFYNSSNRSLFSGLSKVLYRLGLKDLSKAINTLSEAYDVLRGTPNNVALRLAYWKNEDKGLIKQHVLNPTRDKCGLIWYAPLVEMRGQVVVDYIKFIRDAAKLFNVNALITLTTIDDLCFDSTIPILFNLKNEADKNNARSYYEYLLHEGAKRGYFPYRLSIESQKEFKIQQPVLTIDPVNAQRYQ